MDDDWFDIEEFEEEVAAQSQERRANPLQCLANFLLDFWADNTEDEVRLLWSNTVALAPNYASDCLYCLSVVIANPPEELEKFVRERGGLYLYHPDDSATLYSDAETLEWLKQIKIEFEKIYKLAHPE